MNQEEERGREPDYNTRRMASMKRNTGGDMTPSNRLIRADIYHRSGVRLELMMIM